MNRDAPPAAPESAARRRRGSRVVAALLLVASAAMLWWHARALQFFCDDSYISYRFSQNFADGHGLVYNLGERVEGYTNFLWVVLIGGALKLGFAAEPASLWLGVAFLVGALALTFMEGRRLFETPALALVPVALLVCQGPIVLWSISGLESSCFAAMTLAALFAYERALTAGSARRLFVAGALYALSTMVRPDGVVFGAAAGIHLVVASLLARPFEMRRALVRPVALALGFVVVFAPFMLWRHSYYGDWLPNTFYVKAGGRVNAELGVAYFATWLREYPLTAVLTVLGIAMTTLLPRWRAQRRSFLHYALAIVLFCAYIAWAGGDYMALYRFVVPLLPLCALLSTAVLVSGYEGLAQLLGRRLPRPVLAAVSLALLAAGGYALWLPTPRSIDGVEMSKNVATVKRMRRNSTQWSLVGRYLHDQFPADITIATTAAGALPFFAGQRTVDQSGLCDRFTAKVDSDPWMLDRAGHQKQATRKHLGELKPQMIFWHPQIEPPDKAPGILPPTPDYEMRALLVPGLVEEGLGLWFWIRKDVADSWKNRGVVTKEEAKTALKAARSGEGGRRAGGGETPADNDGAKEPPANPKAATGAGGAGKPAAAPATAPATAPAAAPADFNVPRPPAGAFLTRRLHEVDPTADELRASVDDVTRPLWGASGSADVNLSGLAGSVIEFELASAGSDTVLPGAHAPKSVELRFTANGAALTLPLQPLPPLSNGPRAWKRYRADASGAKGAGRLSLLVNGTPAGAGSAWIVSAPRVLDVPDATPRRNVLIVTVDTLRADYLGCYGHDRPTSPSIDALARSGVLFERCVSQAPWTLPSYSSIFTGLCCETHGVVRRDNKLGFAQVTFVEELARSGYATAAIVSGTFTDSFFGFDQGFDDYDDLGMVVDENDLNGSRARGGADPTTTDAMESAAIDRATSPEVAGKAMHWLDAHRDRRFCLFVHFFDPHAPYIEHPGISEKFPPRPIGPDFPNPNASTDHETDKLRALYEGEIAFTDEWIGKLLDHLQHLGLGDETVVVVCADHGEQFKEHGDDPKHNVGHGSSLFNEEVHVPLILRVPGLAPARVTQPVANLDLGPTLLELARAKPGAEWQPQGCSLVPMLNDPAAPRGEPVLSALYRAAFPEKTEASVRVQVAHRLDRGDDCAIEYHSPGKGKVGKTFLFDWVKNPLQDLRQDLAATLRERLDELLDDYRSLRPALEEKAKEPTSVSIDDSQAQKLKQVGYTTDESDLSTPDIPVAPAPPADAKKDGHK